MLTYSRLLNKDRLEGRRLNKATLFLTFVLFFWSSSSHLETWKRWRLVDCGASNSPSVYLIPLSCAGTSHESQHAAPVFSNAKLIQLDFSSIFPPPSKSFILFLRPINPIHIHWAFVAPWKMDFYVPEWTWTICSPFIITPLLPLDICVKSGVTYGSYLIRFFLFEDNWTLFLRPLALSGYLTTDLLHMFVHGCDVCPAVRSPIA